MERDDFVDIGITPEGDFAVSKHDGDLLVRRGWDAIADDILMRLLSADWSEFVLERNPERVVARIGSFIRDLIEADGLLSPEEYTLYTSPPQEGKIVIEIALGDPSDPMRRRIRGEFDIATGILTVTS